MQSNANNYEEAEKKKKSYSIVKRIWQRAIHLWRPQSMIKILKTLIMRSTYKCWSHIALQNNPLKYFAKFTGKHPWRSYFLNNVQAWRPATLLKHKCFSVFFCEFFKTFNYTYFVEHLERLPLKTEASRATTWSEAYQKFVPFVQKSCFFGNIKPKSGLFKSSFLWVGSIWAPPSFIFQ